MSIGRRDMLLALLSSALVIRIGEEKSQAAQGGIWIRRRLWLHGDWKRARIVGSLAVGDGNRGSDIWVSDMPEVLSSPRLPARCSPISFSAESQSYSFVYELMLSDSTRESESREVAAVFRYQKDHDFGVFAAAFRWPFEA